MSWLSNRRAAKAFDKAEREALQAREQTNRKQRLHAHVTETAKHYMEAGFSVIGGWTSISDYASGHFHAIAPDKTLVKVIITAKGGINVELIK